MIATASPVDNLTLVVTQEILVRAPLEATFTALLEQMGPSNEAHNGTPMPMIIEPWPGGRWFRDLGGSDGHFWGHVQAIKRPTLLEITGPLFMSYAVVSNVQYRLSAHEDGTLITLRHNALGMVPDDHRDGLTKGWGHLLEATRQRAQAGTK